MRVFASVLLVVSSAFAYQVTSPSGTQGWTTAGPNQLTWERVDTDPLNFTAVLTNQNISYTQILDALVDGTVGSLVCPTPSGGWPSGSHFRVNLAHDAQHLDTLLAQSNEFDITGGSSSGSTTSSATATTTASGVTGTSSGVTATTASGVTSSDTSTTPTGTSAASLGADTQTGLLTAVAALTALITTLF